MENLIAEIDINTTVCDCCGKKHMSKTFAITCEDEGRTINLGAICASKKFDVNLTGNIFQALKRFNKALKRLTQDEYEIIFGTIYEE
jgi:hypothetical protein